MVDDLDSDESADDGRSAMARGYILASRVTSIGIQLLIYVGLGWWADSTWKTTPWVMLFGVVVGFVVMLMELIQLAKESAQPVKSRGRHEVGAQNGDS